jgi:hypothetical protein
MRHWSIHQREEADLVDPERSAPALCVTIFFFAMVSNSKSPLQTHGGDPLRETKRLDSNGISLSNNVMK